MSKGTHLIIDCKGLPFELCVDDKKLLETLTEAALTNGLNIITTSRYRFGHNSPPGCTIFIMLDASHISLHTYAEAGKMAIDIFTCGETLDNEKIFKSIRDKLGIKDYKLQKIDRF